MTQPPQVVFIVTTAGWEWEKIDGVYDDSEQAITAARALHGEQSNALRRIHRVYSATVGGDGVVEIMILGVEED